MNATMRSVFKWILRAVTVPTVMVTIIGIAWTGNLARAAEIKVLCGTGAKGFVTDVGQKFERETGHTLVMEFGGFAALKRKVDAGATFDVVILSPAIIDELANRGKVVADTRATVGRTGVGVAVRKGAQRPDISSVEAFKRTMLDAQSVAYSKAGSSGKAFLAAIDRLGIAADMAPKMKPYSRPERAVIDGEAEIGVTGIGAILTAPGVELVAGLPPEMQSYVVYKAGVSAVSQELQAANELIQFLSAPAAAQTLAAHGMEPVR